jgi:hypothetical protein
LENEESALTGARDAAEGRRMAGRSGNEIALPGRPRADLPPVLPVRARPERVDRLIAGSL